ncbi:MAG TPA: malto-oligosyltrehalose trehalohydrolase [Candidatus Riflebacteria bacterium]|nr:malto-oligosyltrehalose trehalohydrolase [Candidatus Riflebacteria bacterium]
MTRFRIWAPKARKMTLCVNGKEHAMNREDSGFWHVDIKDLTQPVLYAYKIDGKGPFPDPESRFQPEGVHGRSQLWQDDHVWQDSDWQAPELKNAVIYELHVGTFSPQGTYAGVMTKLEHLVQLGVTHLELMPVAAFPGHHGWGYDGVSLYASHSQYGTPAELKQLIDACHQRGMAVILDVVYNHLGPDGNYLGLYGPCFSNRYKTPWGEAVNFDSAESDQVREFFIDNAMMWLRDYHFDGLRLDAIHEVYDFSAVHILEELQIRTEELTAITGRYYCLIAESSLNDPKIISGRASGGYGLAAQWLDDFHHSLHVLLTGEKHGYYLDYNGHKDIDKCLNHFYVYDGQYSPYRRRRHGRPAGNLPTQSFIASTQTHDQAGNRGEGERLCHLVNHENCQIAAALMLLSPFVPMLFQGEEWAASTPFLYFTDHTDPGLARAVREGRKRDYAFLSKKVPDPQAARTFARSVLKWPESTSGDHAKMLEWYKELIRLRRQYLNDIRKSRRSFRPAKQRKDLYIYDAGRIIVLVNIGSTSKSFADSRLARVPILLQNRPVNVEDDVLTLLPGTAAVMLTD